MDELERPIEDKKLIHTGAGSGDWWTDRARSLHTIDGIQRLILPLLNLATWSIEQSFSINQNSRLPNSLHPDFHLLTSQPISRSLDFSNYTIL